MNDKKCNPMTKKIMQPHPRRVYHDQARSGTYDTARLAHNCPREIMISEAGEESLSRDSAKDGVFSRRTGTPPTMRCSQPAGILRGTHSTRLPERVERLGPGSLFSAFTVVL